ncbi:hypothetical protein L2E82_37350 [Cichorium intybus]|uniref:Uncharacterized protein n=1 Tax=Cichorium intybus TaxID=13427 RepID=A0ACB9AER0_CICIN|nr:hypothetical protein L2E82_37350 [Cichorium intybus]
MAAPSFSINNENQNGNKFVEEQKTKIDMLYQKVNTLSNFMDAARANHDIVTRVIEVLQQGIDPVAIQLAIKGAEDLKDNFITEINNCIHEMMVTQEKINKIVETINRD